jgi:predicted nucleic acid-binding protein
MTLVDTSVWINHFHKPSLKLIALLEKKEVLTHSAVLGEIAAGSMRNRARVLGDLKQLQRADEISAEETLYFIEMRHMYGKGLSWVDLQLIASCLTTKCSLLTEEKRMMKAWEDLS